MRIIDAAALWTPKNISIEKKVNQLLNHTLPVLTDISSEKNKCSMI